jgi:hypothetical protein
VRSPPAHLESSPSTFFDQRQPHKPLITPSQQLETDKMSAGRPVVHQDYIAKIRYSNALPPPPCPPKLLDIPNTGLSSGQYTSAGFASRLAREQPLNIEADAELGMPIDLVGIPKVFDGDEAGMESHRTRITCPNRRVFQLYRQCLIRHR